MFEDLQRRVNADPRLVERGRLVTATVLVGVGETTYRIGFLEGRIRSVEKGPFVMPSCTFGLYAPTEEWVAFSQPVPGPGHHDLFALLKRRVLRLEGDLQPFMANLFYFKGVFALLRPEVVG